MTSLRFDAKACAIPHPDKAHYGGEDAYCCDNSLQLIAVADGVGGFDKRNEADVAEYSRSLVTEVRSFFKAAQRKHRLQCNPNITPQQAIEAAHKRVRKQGASTLCVARLNGVLNCLDVATVGDSRAVVYRNGQVFWNSDTQQHYFNCPFQLGYPISSNTARDAFVYRVPLRAGDVVVIGTDGLWDNVWDEEVMQHLPKTQYDVQLAAERIANAAFEHASDDEYYSPFAAGSFGSSVDWPCGGKPDDITVVVARVTSEVQPRTPDVCMSQGGRGSPSLSISSSSTFDPCDVWSLIDETVSGEGDDVSSCCSSTCGEILECYSDAEAGVTSAWPTVEPRRVWAPQLTGVSSLCHPTPCGWLGSHGHFLRDSACSGAVPLARGVVDTQGLHPGLNCAPDTVPACPSSAACVVQQENLSASDAAQGVSPFALYLSKFAFESHKTNNPVSSQLSFGSVPSNILALLFEGECIPEKNESQMILRTDALASVTLSHDTASRSASAMLSDVQDVHFGRWAKGELEVVLSCCR